MDFAEFAALAVASLVVASVAAFAEPVALVGPASRLAAGLVVFLGFDIVGP